MASISVIVPAFNEEKNLENAVKGLQNFLKKENINQETEIIIFDDCSTDGSGEVADRLAKDSNNIKVIHNPQNMGLGFNFKEGARIARGEYVILFPGDNENDADSLINIFKLTGEADIVISYTSNQEIRPPFRQLVSKIYTILNNIIFGMNLKYYNGLSLFKKDILNKIPSISNSFSYAAEILVTLIKSGASYQEVPVAIKQKPQGKSSAFKIKNIVNVFKSIAVLFWNIRIRKIKISI